VVVVPDRTFERVSAVSESLGAAKNVRTVVDVAVFIQAAKDSTAKQQVRVGPGRSSSPPAAVSIVAAGITDGVLASVMTCIKNHESGNYMESSHIQDGSGAFQAIPSTWRTWSARAGHGGYSYEYLAPPAVQDAVIAYMLTHGGAGNYSPRYGNDPCTVGMGG
jgi:hypothetical protein